MDKPNIAINHGARASTMNTRWLIGPLAACALWAAAAFWLIPRFPHWLQLAIYSGVALLGAYALGAMRGHRRMRSAFERLRVSTEESNRAVALASERMNRELASFQELTISACRVAVAARPVLMRLLTLGHVENHGHRSPDTNCVECQEVNQLEALMRALEEQPDPTEAPR